MTGVYSPYPCSGATPVCNLLGIAFVEVSAGLELSKVTCFFSRQGNVGIVRMLENGRGEQSLS